MDVQYGIIRGCQTPRTSRVVGIERVTKESPTTEDWMQLEFTTARLGWRHKKAINTNGAGRVPVELLRRARTNGENVRGRSEVWMLR